ncbi:hypothetical protein ABZY57_20345 [Streptomyces sp. NPDC006450]|uniref:hypothetical protein n=1 Tax=Streptomyces sp. NPDC006450 TaxID=3155458 RepID=UPI0033B4435B
MKVRFETYGSSPGSKKIDLGEVSTMLESVPLDASVTFTWNDDEDDVLIVGFGEGFAVATMLRDRTFYVLQANEREGFEEVEIGGQWSSHPKRFLMDRSLGLEVLAQAGDMDGLFERYAWVVP